MSSDQKSGADNKNERVADRYQIEELLGEGGMAAVYRVSDSSNGKKLALKRMLDPKSDDEKVKQTEIFEREYLTLAQLAHPRIVEVYDYGVDRSAPFYTMELLDGGDLFELSPLPWKEACSVVRDICSALSLLHSRGFVHCDLTPRNIRCTRDGRAKMIDFGAMVPMGPCKQRIGTPAFTSPEMIWMQTLDARVDLFSLGATLYYAVTEQLAYPAKDFHQLRDVWRSQPPPPSGFVPGIPKELDSLMLSLTNVDPKARPLNAAEVMERLSAIAGLETDENLLVPQAYLSTPTLVGRDEPLLRMHENVLRVLDGTGGTVMIQGPSGVGRSRFLDACILEGKLSGAVVLRADASDAHWGDYGAVRALTAQLFDILPEQTLQSARPYLHVLSHVLPELREASRTSLAPPWKGVWGRGHSSSPPAISESSSIALDGRGDHSNEAHHLRPRLQAGLRDFLLSISDKRFLILAVDDVERIDEPSLALLALVAHQADKHNLLVVVTTDVSARASAPGAIKLIANTAARIDLANLELEKTERLLCSVFGDVPNLHVLANRLYSLTQGNPRAVMEIAHHLVDRGIISYQAGAWSLPLNPDASDLPGSFTETLEVQLNELPTDARELIEIMALCPDQAFSFAECRMLIERGDSKRLHQALDELVAKRILSTDRLSYAFSQHGWVSVLRKTPQTNREPTFHLRLAKMFENRGGEGFRVARHLLLAGEWESGLNALVTFLDQILERTKGDAGALTELIRSMHGDATTILESALSVAQRSNRPLREHYVLYRALIRRWMVSPSEKMEQYLRQYLDHLFRDSGLSFFEQLDETLDSSTRLMRAFEIAQKRYDESSQGERAFTPVEAITELSQTLIQAVSVCVTRFDYELLQSLPSIKPLVVLLPPLDIVDKVVQNVINTVGGLYEQAHRGFLDILHRIAEPDRAGLDDAHYHYVRLNVTYALGQIEAARGFRTALERAEELETDPLHQLNAWRLRMVYYLRQGNKELADQCRKQAELIQIQTTPVQFYEGTDLFTELLAYAFADDLNGVKQILNAVSNMADLFPGWVPIRHFARATYQRIRGDYESALDLFERALEMTRPGRHTTWTYIAADHIATLHKLGRLFEAKNRGEQHLHACREANLSYMSNYIELPFALVEAQLGEVANAYKRCDAVVAYYTTRGISGINLGIAYETGARIALLIRDHEKYQTYSNLCAQQYLSMDNPALVAKYEKLVHEYRQTWSLTSGEISQHGDLEQETQLLPSALIALLKTCTGPIEIAQRSLEILIKKSGAKGGYLFTVQNHALVLAASIADEEPIFELQEMVEVFLSEQYRRSEAVTIMGQTEMQTEMQTERYWTTLDGQQYRPILLTVQTPKSYAIVGVALLLKDVDLHINVPFETVALLGKALYNGSVGVEERQ